ncbi:MAG: deoxyhypusine synthase family protein [Planctomycetota bacterium]
MPPPREPLPSRPVPDCETLEELLQGGFPAFGGAGLRRIWQLLDEAVGLGLPMTLSISGPVTVSGQHLIWLNPLLDTGWFSWISVTDAICYHDGHRSLGGERPFFHVPIHGDDGGLRDEAIIRVTDVGFPEQTLLDQDEFLCGILRRPEFQRRMSGTEFRFLLGRHFAAQEKKAGAPEGLLALCHRKAIPVFVGAPADGSVFLNAMLLWALRETCGDAFGFELDLYKEVFESCAYHRWGLFDSEARNLGTLILGGGVPKNFNLQPEPALGQIFGFENISGFLYDIQLTTAPVSDGSLSSCPPAEAVTWGKVDKEHYRQSTASMQVDYTVVMPFLVKALLEKRAHFERLAGEQGREILFREHPEARGYLRSREGYRLFERRTELMERLREKVRAESARLRQESAHNPSPAPVD